MLLVAICGMLLTPLASGNTIWVDGGNISNSPYYAFYSDSSLTQPLDIY